jgi:hypothetical protein
LNQSSDQSIIFEAEGEQALNPFRIRDLDAIMLERVTAITCRIVDNACEPVRIQTRVVGRSETRLSLRISEPLAFDQAIGAPIIDDRDLLLGIVRSVTKDEEGNPELTAEPIHLVMQVKRKQTLIGAK